MANASINSLLEKKNNLTLLRIVSCGSVDDGKSTLIGRLLYDTKMIFSDQIDTLKLDSKKSGTQGNQIDFALLVDGLSSEKEQGITIDVAYRYFTTEKRKFIIADTPGHEEYTRNMVTGSSLADVAIILVDVNSGILEQTLRHINICNFMGIKKLILVVNKMDTVNYNQKKFDNVKTRFLDICINFDFNQIVSIPASALKGENIILKSILMPWYKGDPLLHILENLNIEETGLSKSFIMPVQYVNRPNSNFRGYCGLVSNGQIKKGDSIYILPNKTKANIKDIFCGDESLHYAKESKSITLLLNKNVSVSRGDCIVSNLNDLKMSDQFEVNLFWLSNKLGHVGREYYLKLNTQTVRVTISNIKFKININDNSKTTAKTLKTNNFYVCNIRSNKSIWYKSFIKNKKCGSFILIDKYSNSTIAAGTINHGLRRSDNLSYQTFTVDKKARRLLNNHSSKVFWFTGLSGSGKSTIANSFEKYLYQLGIRTYILDGDNIRKGLNHDLGFTETDRIENIRRVAEIAKLFVDAGIVVLTSFISPFEQDRQMARSLFSSDDFVEVYLNTSIEICEKRDVKGLYKAAREKKLLNFTGIDSPYEVPKNPDFVIDTEKMTLNDINVLLMSKL